MKALISAIVLVGIFAVGVAQAGPKPGAGNGSGPTVQGSKPGASSGTGAPVGGNN